MPQTPAPMTARERAIADRIVADLAEIDGGAMVHFDGTWLAVDGHFDMGELVRRIVAATGSA